MAVEINIVGGPGRLETKQLIASKGVADQVINLTEQVCEQCVYKNDCDPSSLWSRRKMVAIIGNYEYNGVKDKCALVGRAIIL